MNSIEITIGLILGAVALLVIFAAGSLLKIAVGILLVLAVGAYLAARTMLLKSAKHAQ